MGTRKKISSLVLCVSLMISSVSGLFILSGCGIKIEQLPAIEYPYMAEIEFLKEVKNVNGKARKKRFKQDRVIGSFYFYLKIKEIENSGTVKVYFYSSRNQGKGQKLSESKEVEKKFRFGQTGKYYEYIIFFDRVEGLKAGKHQYAIFINDTLLYEGRLEIYSSSE
jgi:hypothetical protein